MNTYIIFKPMGLEKFAYCIAPDVAHDRYSWERCWIEPVELVTESAVEPFLLARNAIAYPVRDGCVRDREAAIRRAREVIADSRAHDFCAKAAEAPTI